jgi:hypothetical protein
MSPAAGLWVATRRGDHAGVVERRDGTYHARSARGRALGAFADLDSARAVVDGGVEVHQGAPRGDLSVLGASPSARVHPIVWAIHATAALALVAAVAYVL